MIPIKRDMTEEERRKFRRECYENEKEELLAVFKEMEFPEENLKIFMCNSLKGSEEFLKEDGYM